jgi:multiple sugar transport system ATP-binding protein
MADIKVERLHKRFGEFIAVRGSDFTIHDGEFVVMLGPSGCGKTTTLRMIAGLEYPTSGRIQIGGRDVTYARPAERDIAFVFQLFALYPHMTVRQNLAFPLQNEGLPRAEISRRVSAAAELLRIEALLDRGVSGLSGGDRQRVALGRAIVREPAAFLMDEPLGTLDAEFRELMCVELRKLHDRLGATTVFVTHDQREAMAMADRIAVMNQGELLQFADPETLYHEPATMFVGGFVGNPPMQFLPAQQAQGAGGFFVFVDDVALVAPAALADIAKPVLGIRAEHVHLVEEGGVRGEVYGVEYLCARQVVTVRTRVGDCKVSIGKDVPARVGDRVGLSFAPESVRWFDGDSGRAIAGAVREVCHG